MKEETSEEKVSQEEWVGDLAEEMVGETAGEGTAEEKARKRRMLLMIKWTAISVNQTLVMMPAELLPRN